MASTAPMMHRIMNRTLYPGSQGLARRQALEAAGGMVYRQSGALREAPDRVRFGLWKIFAVVTPFTFMGAMMSKYGAAWLEEHDIFVPADEDDD